MNVQPTSSPYSHFPAAVYSLFHGSAAPPGAPVARQILHDDLHHAARQTDVICMQAVSARGEEFAAAAPIANQSHPHHHAVREAGILRMTDPTHDLGAAGAPLSHQIYRIDLHQAARQAEIIRMNAMSVRDGGVAAAAAVSSQAYSDGLPVEASNAGMSRITDGENQGVHFAGAIAAVVSNRISFKEFLKVATHADISALIDKSSFGQYVNALDPAGDPDWAGVFAGVMCRRADVLRLLFEGDPNPSAALAGQRITPSQAAAKANAVTRDGLTALMAAAKSGAADMVEILLRAGAKVDAMDATGTNALMWAVSTDKFSVVSALLKAHPRLNHVNNEGVTALMLAAGNGNVEMVRLLAKAGEDINANLFRTIQGGKYSLEAVKTLLQAEADPNTAVEGCTVLTAAAQRRDPLLMGALLTAGAQLNPLVMSLVSGATIAAGNAYAPAASNAGVNLARHNPSAQQTPEEIADGFLI